MSILSTMHLEALLARTRGPVAVPGDAGWDVARQAWNLSADQRPIAVAFPADAADVAAIVSFARRAGLRVAPQATGHNATALRSLEDAVLVKTSALCEVRVDPVRRRARAGGGTLWQDVVQAAGEHGLAALAGSSPDVGVAGYSLGGGVGWLARRYGLQANALRAVELVTGEGEQVRADDDHEPELFWALRGGGGGNFGVVTAVEFDLFDVAHVYGGALAWDWVHAERVLRRWAEWAAEAPDEITTSARILQLPPLPDVPEPLRGRRLVMVDGAWCGDPAGADAVLRPLRELEPEIDMFGPMPAAGLLHVHGDPDHPVPGVTDHRMMAGLPPEAIDTFVAMAGPGSGSGLVSAELRHLGGALARVPERHGALPALHGEFALLAVGMALDPAMAEANRRHAADLAGAMTPWASGRSYLNFADNPTDTRTAYDAETYERLAAVRDDVDSDGVFVASHPIGG